MNIDTACSKTNVNAGDATQTLKRFSNALNASTATHTLDFKINRGHVSLLDDRCKSEVKNNGLAVWPGITGARTLECP